MVTSPGGATGSVTYTYVAPTPTLTKLTPSSGSTLGGDTVVLTGTNFTGATDVNIGPVDVTNVCGTGTCFSVDSDTQITLQNTPAHAAGGVNVSVTTPGGPTGNLTYTYVTPTPTLTKLTPSSGSTLGGDTVVLTGTNFTGATDVNIGPVDVTNVCGTGTCFSVDSDTQITLQNTPAHAPGGVNVSVTTPGGPTGNLTYTYVTPTPTLTKLTPSSGSTLGGDTVVLTGTNFTGATDVNIGPVDVTNVCGTGTCFSVDSDTQITLQNTPAHAPGGVNVSVTTPGGPTGNLTYTYVTPGPTLTNLNPASGSTLGGNSVILTGTNFTGATHVHVGSTDLTPCGSAACFTFNSDTQITVSMPSGAAGSANVNVTTAGGTSNNVMYTYVTPPPTLTGISPTTGSTLGGNSATLTGTNFTGATDVHVGSTDLTPCGSGSCFTFVSDTQITVTMPSSVPGPTSVNVTTPGGITGNVTYTYIAPGPTVTKVTPNAGAPIGGNNVTLTGTDFEAAGTPIVNTVTVGSTGITTTPCITNPTSACFTVTSATTFTIQVLPAGSGMVNITVMTAGGTSPIGPGNVYTYVTTIPAVTTVSPKFGAASGGAYVTIIGSNFGDPSQGFGATDVRFGTADTIPCPMGSTNACFVQIGTTTLDVYTPAVAAGTIDITVQTPGGNSQAALADRYTYVDKGAYAALSPFRICDTRKAGSGIAANQCDGAGKGTLGPGGAITAQITASGGPVPLNAQAVVVNLTAIDHSSGSTYISAYPTGAQTFASNVNIAGGKAEANLAIVRLSSGGQITLFNGAGSADVIVDVEGYFTTPTGLSAGAFHSIPPLRICDSRGGTGNTTVCATATGRSSAPLVGGVWRHVTLSGLPPGVSHRPRRTSRQTGRRRPRCSTSPRLLGPRRRPFCQWQCRRGATPVPPQRRRSRTSTQRGVSACPTG